MIVRVKAQEIIDQNEKLSAVGYFVSKAYESSICNDSSVMCLTLICTGFTCIIEFWILNLEFCLIVPKRAPKQRVKDSQFVKSKLKVSSILKCIE